MKITTDVARLRPAPGQDSAPTGPQPAACDSAVERATALLIQSMQQSDTPISQLGGALERMARTLGGSGAPLFADSPTGAGADSRAARDALVRDIAVCIQSLQFHDRLMQQLTQARDLLTGHIGQPGAQPRAAAGEASLEGSVELF